jgi:hypothetical protein
MEYVSDSKYSFLMKKCKKGQPGDSIFVRDLADVLWSREVLAKRSVTGAPCVSKANQEAYPACTPSKKQKIEGKCWVSFIFYPVNIFIDGHSTEHCLSDCLKRRMDEEGVSDEQERSKRLKGIRTHLNGKIKSVRLMFSNCQDSPTSVNELDT